MRCVVTGAMGFVGLNVAGGLARRGYDVIAVGRQEPDDWAERFLSDVRDRVQFRVADMAQPDALQDALAGDEFDTMVHAAALTATTAQVERDMSRDIVAVNVGGTMEALAAASRHGVRRFVYVSSPSALGDVPDDAVLDEDIEARPISIYGITKRTSEDLVKRYGDVHRMSTVAVRIAQPYGPGERATASRVCTSPIHEWLMRAAIGEPLITGDPSGGRDWTYIDDTVSGIERLVSSPVLAHDLYHLGCGQMVRVHEVIALLRAEFPDLRVDERSDAPGLNPNIGGSSRRRPLDASRLRNEIGWEARTRFDAGMRMYLDWWRGGVAGG